MGSFRATLTWVVGTAVGLFLLLSAAGYFFLTSHHNQHAQTILTEHSGAIVSVYVRIGVAYAAAGRDLAFVFHPLLRGWKAALATFGVAVLGLVYTLTSETHLLYGPVQTIYCAVHDGIPEPIRNLYRPAAIPIVLGLWRCGRFTGGPARGCERKAIGVRMVVAAAGAGVALWQDRDATAGSRAATAPNFVLITTDSLRADHLHCNGYERETSPHIDALASGEPLRQPPRSDGEHPRVLALAADVRPSHARTAAAHVSVARPRPFPSKRRRRFCPECSPTRATPQA